MSQYNNKQRAAALRYSEAENHAPIVVAAGVGYTASKIIEVAQESNIPVYQDDALASLLSQMNMGTEVPPELYQAVADLYLYFLNYGEQEATPAAANAKKVSPPPEMPDFSEE
ncbi:EscU/YscU/HrcU family type III secretion system export apparatus switch protein [Faecalispora anaeroviscerum]|uniref:EscU/YscU/HrcU family type III secretion system export apparatus switch protein n=1 Tax=Faecalispora anaeroviscerum TaxID=2991836 RepID=UPI0024BB070D|nr:EscU/YscU/HrcU family type III secretion system export apparatus switch protein [Faecalispora anaeroviscerum]